MTTRFSYFLSNRLYRLVWGGSIHFGQYETGEEGLEVAAEATKRRMAAMAGLAASAAVLEVGCGYGATARYLARRFGCRVTATNLSEVQLEEAELLSRATGVAHLVDYRVADYQDLPFGDAAFDVHWSQEALVYAPDKDAYFSEAYRVLKRGGRIVFSEQTTRPALCRREDLELIENRHGNRDFWDAAEFRGALERSGFVVEQAQDWSGHLAHHFARLHGRIRERFAALAEEVDPALLEEYMAIWRKGEEDARQGRIGWWCFLARKPE